MKKYSAFSLIELSIVILIIGILIAGVTQSSRLIKKFRLQTAQSLTQSSPVAGIKDLAVWYETSMDSSFLTAEAQNGANITRWNDSNPQSPNKINALQATAINQPKYTEDVFNGGIPALRFDGTNSYLLSSSVGIVGSGLTYFVVSKRIAVVANAGTLNGVSATAIHDFDNAESFNAFYEGPTGVILASYRISQRSTATHPGNGVPYVASGTFDGTNSTTYLNGIAATPGASSGIFNVDKLYIATRWVNSALTSFYNGDIAEIIIFSRALKSEERRAVEAYLGKKYGIKVS